MRSKGWWNSDILPIPTGRYRQYIAMKTGEAASVSRPARPVNLAVFAPCVSPFLKKISAGIGSLVYWSFGGN